MKFRKDKTNTAIYEAMKLTLKHKYVFNTLNPKSHHLTTHRSGSDMDYLKAEQQLDTFFVCDLGLRLIQLKDKFPIDEVPAIQKRLTRLFYCRGLMYNKKNAYQCHHPLCPLCFHRKHYRMIGDLKPYLSEQNKLRTLGLSVSVPLDQIDMAMESLEVRSRKITASLSPHVLQWSRQPHLAYDEESEQYTASSIIVMIHKKSDTEIDEVCSEFADLITSNSGGRAIMENMNVLLQEILYYDPNLLKHTGSRGLVKWDQKPLGFKYRAKSTHGRKKGAERVGSKCSRAA